MDVVRAADQIDALIERKPLEARPRSGAHGGGGASVALPLL